MPFGYTGSILHVDLTEQKLTVEKPPEEFYRTYMGGGAMGMYYILKELKPGIDPLSPENILTFMCSVVTGAPVSGQSRITVNAKSPMSGGIGDSQAGGFFPAELKFAGFDGIVIRGKSPTPVYLTVLHGEARLHDAAHLMGKVTGEVEEILRSELDDPKIQVLQAGPAAEKGVLFSSLVNMASRNNGRTGMGLVMASKNLKAVVTRGKEKPRLAHPARLAAGGREQDRQRPGGCLRSQQVARDAAEAHVVAHHARAGDGLEQVEDQLALAHTVQCRGEVGAEVVEKEAHRDKVTDDPCELRHNDTQILSPLGHLNAHQLLHGKGIAEVVGHRANVIQSIGERHVLNVRVALTDFFVIAMQVAHHRFEMADRFTFERDDHAEHTVRGWVLRSHVQ